MTDHLSNLIFAIKTPSGIRYLLKLFQESLSAGRRTGSGPLSSDSFVKLKSEMSTNLWAKIRPVWICLLKVNMEPLSWRKHSYSLKNVVYQHMNTSVTDLCKWQSFWFKGQTFKLRCQLILLPLNLCVCVNRCWLCVCVCDACRFPVQPWSLSRRFTVRLNSRLNAAVGWKKKPQEAKNTSKERCILCGLSRHSSVCLILYCNRSSDCILYRTSFIRRKKDDRSL